ncbi:MAG: thioredoxin fold domain-containing protein [Phycisphaeraceae bacterium]|nr:thioredoxin fold domain-containing protein [Phycisphaeraceae bacterium]
MKRRSLRAVVLAVLMLLPLLAASVAQARPEVFADMDLAAARAAAKPDQLLLVDVGATWCAPCKLMDQTTWSAPDVVDWVKEHGLAIQIMADLTPEPADELRVASYPTLVVLKDGQELDRASGYLTPQQLLEWLNGIGQGHTMLTRLREQAGIDGPGPVNVSARIDYAQALLDQRQFEQGVTELVWLWGNIDLATDLRLTPLPMLTQMVLRARPEAHEALAKVRDEQTVRADDPKADPALLDHWALLSAVLGQMDPILAWHQKHTADASPGQLKVMLSWVELAMASGDRWVELGQLHADPIAVVTGRAAEAKKKLDEQLRSAAPDQVQELRLRLLQAFYQRLSLLYAGLLAADRPDQANALADIVGTMDEPVIARMLFVQAGLQAGRARPEFRQWLDEAAQNGAPAALVNALKVQVDQALAGNS